ncbi:MAG TPA: cupin domain-containing protein [Thermoanaerobaculia bacterium]|nr:cupin domain-containing protein [Thermoanaerobaculia bacterium]
MRRDLPAEEVIRLLGLQPHPEGGFFRETFRDGATDATGRSRSTAIYYLLREGEVSAWHRVTDAAEVFHYYAGAALELTLSIDDGEPVTHRLGPDLAAGERPQLMVPAGVWQTSRPVPGGGGWSQIGCTVAPAFEFSSFEMR